MIASTSRTAITVALALAGVCLGVGCKAVEKWQAKQRCNQDRLASLATQLDAAEPDAQVMLVSEGLLEACGEELYPTVHSMLTEIAKPDVDRRTLGEDAALRGAIERICPKHEQIGEIMEREGKHEQGAAVAELCEFSRYDLLGDAELRELGGHALSVWATHDFLLESGTPPKVAKTISRALFRVHETYLSPVLIRPLDGQRLVKVPAVAPIRTGPVVYISSTELVFNEQPLASLEAGRLIRDAVRGHVIVPLFETLDEEREKMAAVLGEGRSGDILVLAVDGRVRFGSVVDAMYTAGRLDYEHFDFVVEPSYPVRRALYIDPFRFSADEPEPPPEEELGEEPPPPPERRPHFKVFILEDAYRVSWGPGEPVLLPKLDAKRRDSEAWDRAGLAQLVRERTAAEPGLVRGTVSAENSITMDVVLATCATMLGPDCKQHEGGAGCLLPELILEAGAG